MFENPAVRHVTQFPDDGTVFVLILRCDHRGEVMHCFLKVFNPHNSKNVVACLEAMLTLSAWYAEMFEHQRLLFGEKIIWHATLRHRARNCWGFQVQFHTDQIYGATGPVGDLTAGSPGSEGHILELIQVLVQQREPHPLKSPIDDLSRSKPSRGQQLNIQVDRRDWPDRHQEGCNCRQRSVSDRQVERVDAEP